MLTQLSATVAASDGGAPLYFHTVPREAVGGADVPLEDVVGRIAPSRARPLSLLGWQEMSAALDDLDWSRGRDQMRVFAPLASDGLHEFERVRYEVTGLAEAPVRRLCEKLLTRPLASPPPLTDGGLLTVTAPAFALSNQVLQGSPAGPAKAETWARLTSLMTDPVAGEETLCGDLLATELPHHNSPQVKGASVDEFLASLRQAVFLPLAGGAVEAASQLSHQEFVLALETTLASGAVTLLLAATANLTDRLLSVRRSRGG
jgi:hypothetical protein